ncbi:MAG: three-Cys-motif partner protein TcmP [Variibacter sp.]
MAWENNAGTDDPVRLQLQSATRRGRVLAFPLRLRNDLSVSRGPMGDLIEGDDGLPVDEVGAWTREKHTFLCDYIEISRGVRAKWLGPSRGGATFIDLFCGPGRSKIRRSAEFIDGGCVTAWKRSVHAQSPFSEVFIADDDEDRRRYAAERLRRAGAPVTEIEGDAVAASNILRGRLKSDSLHFAFIDPYSIGAFDFRIVENLARLKYVDMLVHVSKMDMQRNTGMNILEQQSGFDRFAPGWRDAVNLRQRHASVRREVFEFWREKVSRLGVFPSTDMRLITGDQGQHLYWLTLAARHEIALRFWNAISNKTGQKSLFD